MEKTQVYFDFETTFRENFIIGRTIELDLLLNYFISGEKLINLVGKRGCGKTFFIIKFIQIYKSYFLDSNIFYFNLNNYHYHSIDEILFDFKIFLINSDFQKRVLLILDNYKDKKFSDELINLIKNYNNLNIIILSNKKIKKFKSYFLLKEIDRKYLNDFFKYYISGDNLIYKNFIYLFNKYNKDLDITLRYLKIVYEKNIDLKNKRDLKSFFNYLNFYYFNKELLFLIEFFSFLPEVSEEFVFSLSFYISSNQSELKIFNIFSYDDFIKLLNKFFYNNYSLINKNGKNFYIAKNKNLFLEIKKYILKNERDLIEDFSIKFYLSKKDLIIHLDLFIKNFNDSEKFLNLAFCKIAYFLGLKDNEKVFNLLNSLDEKNIPQKYLMRYLLIKGNIYYFNKSYSEALYYFKKILLKKLGDIFLRETIILKIGYIKNYLGETEEAKKIIFNVLNKSLLGGDYRKYALLTIGEIFYSQNNYKEAILFFLTILKDVVDYLCKRRKEECEKLNLNFNDLYIKYNNLINLKETSIDEILDKNFKLLEFKNVILDNKDFFLERDENKKFYIKLIKDIGICALYLEKFDVSKNMFLISLELCDKNDLLYGIILNNLGVLYKKFGINNKSYYYYLKAYEVFKNLNSDTRIAMVTNNLSSLLMCYKRFDKALYYLNISFEIKKKYNDLKQIGVAYINYGMIYFHINKVKKSYENLKLAYDYFYKSNDINHLVITQSYILLVEIFHTNEIKDNLYLVDSSKNKKQDYFYRELIFFFLIFEKSNKYYYPFYNLIKFIYFKKFKVLLLIDYWNIKENTVNEVNEELVKSIYEKYIDFDIKKNIDNININDFLLELKDSKEFKNIENVILNKLKNDLKESIENLKDLELKNLLEDILLKYKILK